MPGFGTPEWIALDVLAYLLADGDSSRLHRVLVRERQLAQEVDTYLYPTALCGVFGIVATARAGVAPEALEQAVAEVLGRVAAGDIAAEEVMGAVRRVRRDHVAELATVEDRADALAYAATVLGEADAVNRIAEMYDSVTVEDVAAAAREWLVTARAAMLTVLPDEEAGDED